MTFRRLKIRSVRLVVGSFVLPLVISGLFYLGAGVQAQTPSARDVVSPAVYVSAEPAARGVPFQ